MSVYFVIIVVICLLVALVSLGVLLGLVPGSQGSMKREMRNIMSSQQAAKTSTAHTRQQKKLLETVAESRVHKRVDSRLTLEKKLKYAQWKLPVLVFYMLEMGISIFAFSILLATDFHIILASFGLLAGSLFMRWLLNLFVDRRFKAFDADYPSFLLSLTGLLKTGMDVMGGLEAAAQGLEEGSLVKEEVEMMIERLRFGVSEDKSIGSFGEDIFHPEIELFVQALLLSRRVGGTLSETLERLARQVRRRQYFRASAKAAVGMQRGSIWFIIVVLVAMQTYLFFTFPEVIIRAINDETGWIVWQGGIAVISLGIFWIRQVTKIRV